MAEDYEVGFGKPPRHTRFRKGCSGHPEGRPKGATNVRTEMKRLLGAKTTIKVGGEVQKVPMSRAICLAVIQKALNGDVRAFSKVVEMQALQVGAAKLCEPRLSRARALLCPARARTWGATGVRTPGVAGD